jgi:tetratricopeptide (TPR) repeat protein
MPSQTVTTITHAALTNHRITARADEPLPDVAFRANNDSGLIDLTAAAGQRSQPDPVTLLQAYASVIRDGHLEFKPKLNDLLDGLSRHTPINALVLSALARRAMTVDSPEASEQAIRYFKAALQKNPASSDNYILLASVYARRGRSQEAVQVLMEGMPVSPYVKEFPESLAVQYMELGKYGDALKTIRRGLEVFPGDRVLRTLQKKAAAATLDDSGEPH